ncbi:MAG: hypothetical protein MHMPM18_005193 [Marteilia pararefringens]
MDNQPTSSQNESQDRETSSRNELNKQATPEESMRFSESVNSCCLVQSFWLHGMFISAAVVHLQNQNEFDSRYTVPIILSLLLMALQFFSSLLLAWCRYKTNTFFCQFIATFAFIMQIVIFLCGSFQYGGKFASDATMSTSGLNILCVVFWYVSLLYLLLQFNEYINQTGNIRNSFEISYLGVSVLSLIVWKQALISFLSIMLLYQKSFSSASGNALYFICIIIHLFSDIVPIMEFGVLRSLSWYAFIRKWLIVSFLLNFITFIGFMISSYVGRSKLSSLQTTIWSITIATFFLELIFTICIAIKAFRKLQNPTSNDIQPDLPHSFDDHNHTSNTQSQTSNV